MSIAQQAEVGKAFFGTTAMILLGLVGLAAPAATAGAICLDKARGNLTLLFATDLSDAEIVLGKLAARLVPVLGLILCATPVMSIATLFGGIDPVGLVGTLLVVLACAVFGCALALTLSVWGRKTHEVLMATYVFGILYLLAAPIPAGIQAMLPSAWWPSWLPSFMDLLPYNPVFLVLATLEGPPPGMAAGDDGDAGDVPRAGPGGLGGADRGGDVADPGGGDPAARPGRAGVAASGVGGVVDRRRSTSIGSAGGPRRRSGCAAWCAGSWPGRRWTATRCSGASASGGGRRAGAWRSGATYVLLCGGFSLYAIGLMIDGQRWGRELGMVVNALQVAGGLLMLSVSAATSLAEERQRGSLDVLMATPLPTRSIVWGKWWGTFRAVPPLLILPVAVAFALASHTGRSGGWP